MVCQNIMTLEFRDHQIVVISPGSSLTQVQMSFSESLMPPAFEVPTVVYRDTPSGKFSMNPTQESIKIYPIVKGEIKDDDAFHYLLKMIYKSVKSVDGLPPAVYLVASLTWTRRQLERIAQYLFEEAGIPALSITLQGTAASFAFATSDCMVIDIGLEKTEITAVSQFEANRQASTVVPAGGNTVNEELSKLLPHLSSEQIEALKRSDIYEVLNETQASVSASSGNGKPLVDEEEGLVDIAAIVSSGRTREILDNREKQLQGKIHVELNYEKVENTFIDPSGQEITVAKERFKGADKLLSIIVDGVADVLHNLQPKEQEHAFANIVVTGKGSLILGLKNELAHRLETRYVVKPHGVAAAIANAEGTESLTQGPSNLNITKLPDHFPEWKNRKWEDYTFLGAQIGAKQSFTTGIEGLFVSRQDYSDVGPSCVWDVCS